MNKNKITEKFSDSKLLKMGLILTAFVLPHLALKILGIEIDVNPFVLTGVLFTGFIFFLFLLDKSIKHPVIPYFLLQLTIVWIFFGKKILSPFGLDFKPHAVIFLLAFLCSGYFLITKFKYLWAYRPFRYIFGFFLISTVYAVFYKTDFRSSSYIDLWIQSNAGLKFNALGSGAAAVSRNFGSSETKFLIYLAGLAPLVAFLTGFNSFSQISDTQELKNKLYKLMSFISISVLIYYLFWMVSIIIGSSTVTFMNGRLTFNGGVPGGDFEAILLMLMITSYYFYPFNHENFKFYKTFKTITLINIVILLLLILLGIKKGTILSLGTVGFAVFGIIFAVKKLTGKNFISNIIPQKNKVPETAKSFNPMMFFVPVLLLAPVMFINTGFVEDTIYNISNRFASTSTLDIRMINWDMYITYWMNNLDLHKFLFGFGIDSSREATFFLTAMHPNPSYQQPHIHNIYLEMFYNYGLMAFLFFLPFVFILQENLKDIFIDTSKSKIRIFNVLSVGVIVFFLVFYLAESPSMTSIIITFALLGFLESIRRAAGQRGEIITKNG
ncbi:MAG: O-antigen ligase family protein [Candidatus Aenigmarchaeota archaeon]|nr:O-antigen ligase family protein [Candidatus Aenigmarchaeota archaeon]